MSAVPPNTDVSIVMPIKMRKQAQKLGINISELTRKYLAKEIAKRVRK